MEDATSLSAVMSKTLYSNEPCLGCRPLVGYNDDFPGQESGVRWNVPMTLLIGGDEGAVGADFGHLHLLTPLRAAYDQFGHAFGRRLKPHLDPQRAGEWESTWLSYPTLGSPGESELNRAQLAAASKRMIPTRFGRQVVENYWIPPSG